MNLVPVNHGSSGIIEVEEADECVEETSQQISQSGHNESVDQIISELWYTEAVK